MTRQKQFQVSGGALGTKAVSIGDLDEFLEFMASDSGTRKLPQELYKTVAWTYWCVNLRANNIAAIPYTIYTAESTEDSPEFEVDFPVDLTIPIWGASTWLDLVGASYWLKLENDTGVVGLQVLNSNTMRIEFSNDNNNVAEFGDPFAFVQTVGGKKKVYQPDEIVYFRTFDPSDDVREGISSGQVGSLSGTLILNANEWASRFFKNGAIPAVLLEAEGQVPDSEIKRLRSAWDRLLQRTRQWSTMILRKGMKANIIGQPIKDLAMPELSKDQKEQIIAAHDLPIGFAESKTNRAERQQLEYELYSSHLIPYVTTKIAPVINKTLLNPIGLRIVFKFKEIEAIQREQVSQAEASAFLFSDVLLPALSVNAITVQEYRRELDVVLQWMNLPALDKNPVLPAFQTEVRQDVIEGEIADIERELPPGTNLQLESGDQGGLEKKAFGGKMPPEVRSELGKWAQKCRRRNKATTFNSDIIPAWFKAQVESAIETVGHVEAFSFLKATDTQIRRLEKQMERATQSVFDEFDEDIAQAVVEQREPDYRALFAALSAAILPIITSAATDEALRASAEIGVEFDPSFINADAIEWARQYTFDLVTGLTNTTRRNVRDAVSAFLETPGMTQGDVEKLLSKTFSPERAEMIATTEITRANAQATNVIQERLNEQGLQLIRVWNTRRDELVCFVCGPLNGTPEIVWAQQFPGGPPAHPRCVLPDNVVSVPGLIAGIKSFYSGMAVEICTANGRSTTVTENHPILTRRGWVPAQFLTQLDDVFICSNIHRVASSIYPDYEHVPALVDEVFNAIKMSRFVFRGSMPVAAEDLHGEGRNIYGNVDIVWPNGALLSNVQAGVAQPTRERVFDGGNITQMLFNAYRAPTFFVKANSTPTGGIVSGNSLLGSLSGRHSRPFQQFGLGATAGRDAIFDQGSLDDSARKARFVRQFFTRFAGDITSDKVVRIRYFNFTGHVYDLQSNYGLYISNGIVSSNCRCSTTLSALGDDFHLKEAGQRHNERVRLFEEEGDEKLIALAKMQRKEFRDQWLRRN